MNYDSRELCLIWLDSFIGLEYKHKKEIFEKLSDNLSISSLLSDCGERLRAAIGEGRYATLKNSANTGYLDYVLEGLERRKIKAVTVKSKDYPELLSNIDLPPLVLYTKGDTGLLKSETFSIVGSRKNLPLSLGIAKNYTEKLCEAGFTVVTGIAEGIDETVLATALAVNGKAISVIAGGLNHVYPSSNNALADKIAERGLLISEQPPEVRPMPYLFPIRNRIISGLSKGLLLVSGGEKSGTVYTVDYALSYGRDVFAIPYSIGVESGKLCNKIIKEGAMLSDSPSDILLHYGKTPRNIEETEYSEEEKRVISALKEGPKHIEKICALTGMDVAKLSPTLMNLEIEGKICKTGTNVYGLVSD